MENIKGILGFIYNTLNNINLLKILILGNKNRIRTQTEGHFIVLCLIDYSENFDFNFLTHFSI